MYHPTTVPRSRSGITTTLLILVAITVGPGQEVLAQSEPSCPLPTVQRGKSGVCALTADVCLDETLIFATPRVHLNGEGHTVTNCTRDSAQPAILVAAPAVEIGNVKVVGFPTAVLVMNAKSSDPRKTKLVNLSATSTLVGSSGIWIIDSNNVLVDASTFAVHGVAIAVAGDSHGSVLTGNTIANGLGINVSNTLLVPNGPGNVILAPFVRFTILDAAGATRTVLEAGYRSNLGNTGERIGPTDTIISGNTLSTEPIPTRSGINILDESWHTLIADNRVTPQPPAVVSSLNGIYLAIVPGGLRTEPGHCGEDGRFCVVSTPDCACTGVRTFVAPTDHDPSGEDTLVQGNVIERPAQNGLLVSFHRGAVIRDNIIEGGSATALVLTNHGVDGSTVVTGNRIYKRAAPEGAPPSFGLAMLLNGSTIFGSTPTSYRVSLSENEITGRLGLLRMPAAELSAGGIGNLWTVVGCAPMTELLTVLRGGPTDPAIPNATSVIVCGAGSSTPVCPPSQPEIQGIQDSHQLFSLSPATLCP
jgi:hypothetical protein